MKLIAPDALALLGGLEQERGELRVAPAQLEERADRRLAVVDEACGAAATRLCSRASARTSSSYGSTRQRGAGSAATAIEHLLGVAERRGRGCAAARSGGRGRRPPPRRRARRAPRAPRGRPPRPPPGPSRRCAAGRRAARPCTSPRAARLRGRPACARAPGSASCGAGGSSSPLWKHVRAPVWHAGPAGSTSASSASPSQSRRSARDALDVARTSRPCATAPARERLHRCSSPVSRVRCDGLGVGVGEGQHLPRAPVLHDDRDEAALVVGDLHLGADCVRRRSARRDAPGPGTSRTRGRPAAGAPSARSARVSSARRQRRDEALQAQRARGRPARGASWKAA